VDTTKSDSSVSTGLEHLTYHDSLAEVRREGATVYLEYLFIPLVITRQKF